MNKRDILLAFDTSKIRIEDEKRQKERRIWSICLTISHIRAIERAQMLLGDIVNVLFTNSTKQQPEEKELNKS